MFELDAIATTPDFGKYRPAHHQLERVAINPEYLANYGPAYPQPELTLWRAVILVALQDAAGPAGINRSTMARRFLAGRGLRIALELADIPTERAPILRGWTPVPARK